MNPFDIGIADARVRIWPLHASLQRFCGSYVLNPDASAAPERPDLELHITSADIENEHALATPGEQWPDDYLETLAVLRRIAEWAPLHDRLLMHGATIAYAGRAYMFCAPSGTGKSTHVRLWRERFGTAVTVVNGDKPFLRFPEQGIPLAYGTPWAGKEGWETNTSAPLSGICLLDRCEPGHSTACEVSPAHAVDQVFRQVYLPEGASAADRTLALLDRLLARVPVYRLACDISQDAVDVSFDALIGAEGDIK